MTMVSSSDTYTCQAVSSLPHHLGLADAQTHDAWTLVLSLGLCTGLIISYLPQVCSPSPNHQSHADNAACPHHPSQDLGGLLPCELEDTVLTHLTPSGSSCSGRLPLRPGCSTCSLCNGPCSYAAGGLYVIVVSQPSTHVTIEPRSSSDSRAVLRIPLGVHASHPAMAAIHHHVRVHRPITCSTTEQAV